MQHRPFGAQGPQVVAVGQGTWNMESDDRDGVIAAIRRGLDLGMTHIDTAELYGMGRVEQLLGAAIEGRRDEVFLVSKVMPSNASRQGTVAACERSLARLKTDRLDCYLLHWPGNHPLEETIAGFEDLCQQGKILSWGVSNFDARDLEAALQIAGPGRIACNQVLYHLGERAIEHSVIPWCRKQGVAVVAYSPYGSGNFPPSGSAGIGALREIARNRNATVRQVALAFLIREPSLFAIPKAGRADHVAENAGAGGLELTEAEIARIDAAFPRGKARGLPMI